MRRYYGAESPATRTCPRSCPPAPSSREDARVLPRHDLRRAMRGLYRVTFGGALVTDTALGEPATADAAVTETDILARRPAGDPDRHAPRRPWPAQAHAREH